MDRLGRRVPPRAPLVAAGTIGVAAAATSTATTGRRGRSSSRRLLGALVLAAPNTAVLLALVLALLAATAATATAWRERLFLLVGGIRRLVAEDEVVLSDQLVDQAIHHRDLVCAGQRVLHGLQQSWSEHDGQVRRAHLVHLGVLGHLVQKLDQVAQQRQAVLRQLPHELAELLEPHTLILLIRNQHGALEHAVREDGLGQLANENLEHAGQHVRVLVAEQRHVESAVVHGARDVGLDGRHAALAAGHAEQAGLLEPLRSQHVGGGLEYERHRRQAAGVSLRRQQLLQIGAEHGRLRRDLLANADHQLAADRRRAIDVGRERELLVRCRVRHSRRSARVATRAVGVCNAVVAVCRRVQRMCLAGGRARLGQLRVALLAQRRVRVQAHVLLVREFHVAVALAHDEHIVAQEHVPQLLLAGRPVKHWTFHDEPAVRVGRQLERGKLLALDLATRGNDEVVRLRR
mmetsp:Transcript_39947/g.97976  ORF Transcript_39947/g.97976 Transcript_39947/m.97976 type:complete len:462 (+) Transcript_39947:936-2321(+)